MNMEPEFEMELELSRTTIAILQERYNSLHKCAFVKSVLFDWDKAAY